MIIDLTPKNRTGRWFAWHPVWIGWNLVWLQHIDRYYGHKGERVFWVYQFLAPQPNATLSTPSKGKDKTDAE